MNRKVKLEASLACANLKNLEADIEQLNATGIDYLHIDIMDGKFVPNFALDFGIMRAARELSKIPQECHLMVVEPERYIDRTVAAGAEYVSIHGEATYHLQRALQQIRDAGAKSGIALNPATPLTKLIPAMLRKIKDVKTMLSATGHDNVEIQVDGNVSFQHIPAMVGAGATMLVGGTSSVFHKDYSIAEAVAAVREILKGVEASQ